MASLEERIAATQQKIASAYLELDQLRNEQAEVRRGAARIETLLPTSSPSEILARLRRDGVVAIAELASSEQMDTLQAELAELAPFLGGGNPDGFGAGHYTNGSYLVAACKTSQTLALQPVLTEVAEELLSPHAQRIALAVAVEFKIDGEKRAQEMHRDDEECELPSQHPPRPPCLSFLLAVLVPKSWGAWVGCLP
eukprot:COSAG06_NODE_1181_length_10363_cov_10.391563_6_plen_196_part_00